MVELVQEYKPLIDVLGACLSPIIAATVAFIAYQQWQTNKRRERREARQAELAVYHRVRRFLHRVDETRTVPVDLFQDLTEAIAEADFLFPQNVREWLQKIEDEASSLVDGHQRIEAWRGKGDEPPTRWLQREEKHMAKSVDALQNAHCELLDLFRPHIGGL